MDAAALASRIDHTLLRPTATDAEAAALAEEAAALGCAAACVALARLPAVVAALAGTPVIPCCVTGFPLGAGGRAAKVFETAAARRLGAGEIDTVIDLGLVKAGRWAEAEAELAEVVAAARPAAVKVILETSWLTDEEKRRAVAAAVAAGAAFVKTSTGFGPGGATPADVRLLAAAAAGAARVKAAGGIATLAAARALLAAGADRLGMSRTRAVLSELRGGGRHG